MEPDDPRTQQLSAFLCAAARASFETGCCDCAMFMADWCRAVRGIDPAAPLRGRYRTPLGAARHVRRFGGYETMSRDLMRAAGFMATDAPRPGDVGLIMHPVAGPVFAIRTRLGWAVKSPEGVGMVNLPVLAAWTV